MRVLCARLSRWMCGVWRLGEGRCTASKACASGAVWLAWQRRLHVRPRCPAPAAYLMGPAHSGKHQVAKALLARALAEGHACFWLSSKPIWGRFEDHVGRLYRGRCCSPIEAAIMLECLLLAHAADLVVWVLEPPVCHAWLVALWPKIWEMAQASGACVLVVAPASPVDHVAPGPRWHLASKPWSEDSNSAAGPN